MNRSIAKLCASHKQHFAIPPLDTDAMVRKPINQVLAEALRFYMSDHWNNVSLGKAAGVAPNTVANYLNPEKRARGASGKQPSAKLTELAQLAEALGVEVCDLVTDMSDTERSALQRRRAGEFYAEHGYLPKWAPTTPAPPSVGAHGHSVALVLHESRSRYAPGE